MQTTYADEYAVHGASFREGDTNPIIDGRLDDLFQAKATRLRRPKGFSFAKRLFSGFLFLQATSKATRLLCWLSPSYRESMRASTAANASP